MTGKRRILCSFLLVLLLVGIGIRSLIPSYASVFEANWGIQLPVKALCRQIFATDTGPSFHGDGTRYHVFSYRYEDYIDLMIAWRYKENATLFYDSYSETAEKLLSNLQVPEELYPDYDNCFYCYRTQEDNSELLIFWNPECNRLYVLEQFL